MYLQAIKIGVWLVQKGSAMNNGNNSYPLERKIVAALMASVLFYLMVGA